MSAEEAKQCGLVSRVVPTELYLEEALKLASEVASMSPVAVRMAKEAVNRVFESHLEDGLHFERKNFYLTFASEDQKEGMAAFIEKRKPKFSGK
jgi:enoyl-CoA hydratase